MRVIRVIRVMLMAMVMIPSKFTAVLSYCACAFLPYLSTRTLLRQINKVTSLCAGEAFFAFFRSGEVTFALNLAYNLQVLLSDYVYVSTPRISVVPF